jgi:hypothetical protein
VASSTTSSTAPWRRLPLFEKPADYAVFLRVLAEALEKCPMRILSFDPEKRTQLVFS